MQKKSKNNVIARKIIKVPIDLISKLKEHNRYKTYKKNSLILFLLRKKENKKFLTIDSSRYEYLKFGMLTITFFEKDRGIYKLYSTPKDIIKKLYSELN